MKLLLALVAAGAIIVVLIPRAGRVVVGAADVQRTDSLAVLRNAVELYRREHKACPVAADGTPALFEAQLLMYTDATGAVSASRAAHPFGPYLRRIPPLQYGSKKGSSSVKIACDAEAPGRGAEAWIYYPSSGVIRANLADAETDARGTAYNLY